MQVKFQTVGTTGDDMFNTLAHRLRNNLETPQILIHFLILFCT